MEPGNLRLLKAAMIDQKSHIACFIFNSAAQILAVSFSLLLGCSHQIQIQASALPNESSRVTRSWADVDELISWQASKLETSHRTIAAGVIHGDESKFYGFVGSGESGTAPTEHTVYGINSMTKVFTDLLLSELVTEEKIRLDDPADAYLPGIKLPKFNSKPVTVRSLANQTSGLPFLPDNMPNQTNKQDPYAGYSDQDEMSYLSRISLKFEPGTQYSYSNLAFGLLGCILGRIDHRSYSEMVDKRIATPLGLSDTRAELTQSMKARVVVGYDADGNPLPIRSSNECMKGSWAIFSTTHDLLRFLDLELHPEKSPLPQVLRLSQERSSIEDTSLNWIGYPWDIRKLSGSYGKGGSGGGYDSEMIFNSRRQTAIVILTNSWPASDRISASKTAWDISTELR